MNAVSNKLNDKIETPFLLGTSGTTIYIVNPNEELYASGYEYFDLNPGPKFEELLEDKIELMEYMKLSESSLAKDWNNQEEDEAWNYL